MALVIAAVVAFLRPVREPATEPREFPSPPQTSATEPTIQLPVPAMGDTADDLRKELLQLSAELRERFPRVPEALHVVAQLHANFHMVAEAEQLWQQCIELAPAQPGPYVGLATAAMELGKDEDAAETLRRARAAGCSSEELYIQLAAALTKLGELEDAASVLREGVAAFPRSAESWFQLGQTRIQLGQFADAEAALLKARAQGYASEKVLLSLATACARQGKAEAAAKYREEFNQRKAASVSAERPPFQVRYDADMRRVALTTMCQAGAIYDRQGDTVAAERLFLRGFALDPRHTTVCHELISLYRRQGRIADARLVQRRLVEAEPLNVVHYVNLASLSSQLGDHRVAEAALKQVVTLRPELPVGYAGLAQLYLRTGQSDKARWFAEAALRLEPTTREEAFQTYMALAMACRQMGDAAAAEAALRQAEKLAPRDANLPPQTAPTKQPGQLRGT